LRRAMEWSVGHRLDDRLRAVNQQVFHPSTEAAGDAHRAVLQAGPQQFGVAVSTAIVYVRRRRGTGSIAPGKMGRSLESWSPLCAQKRSFPRAA
jgi:hypothetical protein